MIIKKNLSTKWNMRYWREARRQRLRLWYMIPARLKKVLGLCASAEVCVMHMSLFRMWQQRSSGHCRRKGCNADRWNYIYQGRGQPSGTCLHVCGVFWASGKKIKDDRYYRNKKEKQRQPIWFVRF